MVVQMYQEQVTSATITTDNGGGVLRDDHLVDSPMVPRWGRFWWISISRYQLWSPSGLWIDVQTDAWSLKCIRIKEKAQLSQSMTVVACFVPKIRRCHAWALDGVDFGGFS